MIQLKENISILIANAKTELAIKQLLEVEYIQGKLEDDIKILDDRFEKLISKGKIAGTLEREEYTLELNRINEGVFKILERLPSEAEFLEFKRKRLGELLDISPTEVTNIFESLIARYEERIRQKLNHRLAIPLKLTYTYEGLSDEFVQTFFYKKNNEEKKVKIDTLQTLQSYKHLLILGDPGTGKTTHLIKLAINWMRQSTELSIPVVFNLGALIDSNQSFDVWLENALVSGYGFSNEFAKRALKANLILPLFDGLDEVGNLALANEEKLELRRQCLSSIDQYMIENDLRHFVICSRREEYIALEQDAPVRASILINPLSVEQIENEIKKVLQTNKELSNSDFNVLNKLQQLLKEGQTDFVKVLCIPFYFNLAFETEILRLSTSDLKKLPKEQSAIQSYLVEEFLNLKLSNFSKFTKEQSEKYFSWLSNWLQRQNLISFELADFQPFDLHRKKLTTLLGSIIFCLLLCIIFLPIEGIVSGLENSLGSGSSGNHFIERIFDINSDDYFQSRLYRFAGGFVNGIETWIILGIPILFPLSIITGFWGGTQRIKTEDIQHYHFKNLLSFQVIKKLLWGSLKTTLIFAIIVAGVFTIIDTSFDFTLLAFYIGALIGFLIGFFESAFKAISEISHFKIIISPYFRLKRGLLPKVVLLIVIILFGSVLFFEGILGAFKILIIAMISLFLFHKTPLVRHFMLRLGFFLEKKLPLSVVDFFNKGAELRILEKDGGQWRFRHKILQDYFTSQNEVKNPE